MSYLFGAFLVVVGIMRAKYLGAPRRLRVDDYDTGELERGAGDSAREPTRLETRFARGPAEKRHLRWGIAYVLMGLFLALSTYVQMRRQGR